MSRAITIEQVKTSFHLLVRSLGGVEAAAAILGITHQRVSQMQSLHSPDLPSILQISQLECVAERAIVTGAAARAIEGDHCPPISGAVVDAVTRTAATLRLVSDMEHDGQRNPGEIRAVRKAAQETLRAAEQLADAAASLTPGRCA